MTADCLAMPAGDGQGWSDLDVPVADMLTPFQKPDTRQSWERRSDGYIYRAERADQITGKPVRFSFQLVAAGQHQTRVCGPTRYGVARINADGTDLMGWDLINFLPSFIAPAAEMREDRASGSSRPAAPPPPVGTPVGPITPPPPGQSWAPPPSAYQAASHSPATTPPPSGASSSPAKPEDALYSQTYRTCMATGDAADGVTSGILNCVGAETDRQDAQLNQGYRAAMARLPPQQAQALRTSERAWIKARDAGCRASMGDEAEGTMGSILYAQCVLEEETKRVGYIEGPR